MSDAEYYAKMMMQAALANDVPALLSLADAAGVKVVRLSPAEAALRRIEEAHVEMLEFFAQYVGLPPHVIHPESPS